MLETQPDIKPTYAGDTKLSTQAGVDTYYGKGQFGGSLDNKTPQWVLDAQLDASAAREPLQHELDARRSATISTADALRKQPRPVSPRAKESLENRMRNDIFGGSKEAQDWYFNALKDAIEKMPEADLYKFVKEHSTFGDDKRKGNLVAWNSDFAKFMKVEVDPKYQGKNKAITDRRIVAAAQYYLEGYFGKSSDVFKITGNDPNEWIRFGSYGPYTNSLFSAYGDKKFLWGTPGHLESLGNSKLGPIYDEKYPNKAKAYNEAISYKDEQIPKVKGENGKDGKKGRKEFKKGEKTSPEAKNSSGKYAVIDHKIAEKPSLKDLKLEGYEWKNEAISTLPNVIATAYDEPLNGDPAASSRSYHLLALLERRMGGEVDKIQIEEGYKITVDADRGWLIIQNSEGAYIREISLNPPEVVSQVKKGPESGSETRTEDADGVTRALYAKRDTQKEMPLGDLVVEKNFDHNISYLSLALSEAFGEEVGKGIKWSEAPKTFHTLNLLAQKLGAQVDVENRVKSGDTLKITSTGLLTIITNGTVSFRVQLGESPSAKKVPTPAPQPKSEATETE